VVVSAQCYRNYSTHPTYQYISLPSLAAPLTLLSHVALLVQLHPHRPYRQVYDTASNTWFEGGQINTCYNCVDRHIEAGYGDKTAIIFDSPVTNDTVRKLTYHDLKVEVTKLAQVLTDQGINKGDRIIIYLPNLPEAAIAMLACARIGAIHSVVFGGFAANELAVRIKDCQPKLIISASCGIDGAKKIPYKPLLDEAIEIAASEHKVERCVILQRRDIPSIVADLIPGRDVDWKQATESVLAIDPKVAACQPMEASDPLYILYTSGTTGKPKGVVRDNGGHAVALRWATKFIYDARRDDIFWAASDVGWVVGHSFSVYGPLLRGCTTLIYEGKPVGTPDAVNFWRTINRHKVNIFFTAPTSLRAIKSIDPDGIEAAKLTPCPSLRTLFLAGERADKDTIQWAENHLKVPVRDHWWQTETGWPICSNVVGRDGYLPIKYGSCFKPVPGYQLEILDPNTHKVIEEKGKTGTIAIKLPLPPGCLPTLWGNHDRFLSSYMQNIPGYYDTSDAGYIDQDGYVFVVSRVDDVINVAGHRLSTGAMEEVLTEHHDIAEAAVVGVRDKMKGQMPLGLIVINAQCNRNHDDIVREAIAMIRAKIGAVCAFKKAVVVKRLPKTRSGKILRATLRAIANGDEYKIPATIDDPEVLTDIIQHIDAHHDD
jgi:propionyl-CoA synthetase